MPSLAKLLDVQDLDLAADALRERRRALPERAERVENQRLAASLDEGLDVLERQRAALSVDEHALEQEAAAVAAKAQKAEDTLYSGTVKVAKELEGFQEEVRLLRAKQAEIEDRELGLMEQIEQTEAEMSANRKQRAASDARERELAAAITGAEAEIDAELDAIATSRAAASAEIPAEVMQKYDALRANERLKGRAAAPLEGGMCQACRMDLAVMEYNRIKQEPPEALVRCTHCTRVLVR